METEPKRKLRRFQFRLRTLMIGVTLLAVPCAYVGWQAKFVRERHEMLKDPRVAQFAVDNEKRIPWIRRCLGDFDGIYELVVGDDVTEAEVTQYRILFPEATVLRRSSPLVTQP